MKSLIVYMLLFPSVAYSQIEVSDKTIDRLLSEDSKEKASVYYRGEIDEAQAIADAERRSNRESQKKLTKYQEKILRLEQENDSLRNQPQGQSPAQIGASLGNIPGNRRKAKVQPTSKRRRNYHRSKLSFSVSKEESEPMTILPAGSWVRAKILTGVQANSKYPYNVLMQLDYAYTGPNKTKIPLDGCLIIGGATADLSIERVIISPHTLSCVRDTNEYIQRKIKGYVAGRDSSNGVIGVFDSKQSKVFLAAVLSGVVKGASEAYQIANTQTKLVTGAMGTQTPVTSFNGNFKELALAKAVGNPAEMVTNWYLRQAMALLPTINIGSGQDVWIIMTDSTDVPDLNAWEY